MGSPKTAGRPGKAVGSGLIILLPQEPGGLFAAAEAPPQQQAALGIAMMPLGTVWCPGPAGGRRMHGRCGAAP